MFIVQTSCAKMPSSCRGTYRNVAVLEVDEGISAVTMISERAKGVRKIVKMWRARNVGYTARCAFQIALKEANELCESLNEKEREKILKNIPVIQESFASLLTF